ncbi:c6 zinc finger domain-containing protein [Fusarium phyllophilum]|uniref:C6 zinc finger domain-containing protein n=1 Tax=Fusarium phyllophilum TaxID=47803 RepID=A0A8H5K8Y8_9HYPO|nr:c6 zinc finger domain-containing protein [Fusarium phyllophilum]
MVQNGTPLPAKLASPPLSNHDAIADAYYRAFLSIDQSSEELLKLSVTPNIYTDIAFKINVSERVDTVHYLTNMRVSVDTEVTARVTFSAMAMHCILGKGYESDSTKFTTGAFYYCEAVKVDDLWKLKTMKSSHVWSTGDRSIIKPPQ